MREMLWRLLGWVIERVMGAVMTFIYWDQSRKKSPQEA